MADTLSFELKTRLLTALGIGPQTKEVVELTRDVAYLRSEEPQAEPVGRPILPVPIPIPIRYVTGKVNTELFH